MSTLERREPVILQNQGQKIFGVLHRPPTDDKCPGVLICHGLAGNKIGRFRLYVLLAQKLAQAGIAALRIDFRGSGDSEGDFSDCTVESQISDAIIGEDFLRNHPQIDPSRIGIFGRSFGGAVAVMTAKRTHHVKSLALWAPFFCGEPWLEHWKMARSPETPPALRDELMRVNGQLGSYTFFEQFFSLHIEKELQSLGELPLLHVHGEKDVRVTTSHADKYLRCRKSAKGDTRFLRLPNSDHDFSHPLEQLIAIQETTQWFQETL